jgi:hypothetical protein
MLESIKDIDHLVNVGGSLKIDFNPKLKNLEGLLGIHQIKGDLFIDFNDQFVDLKGLDSLKIINGSLNIVRNSKLKCLKGLNQTESIVCGVLIIFNVSLINYRALEKSIKDGMTIFDVYSNKFNPSLTQVQNGELKQ